jgi:hypothetical protein
VTSILRKRFVKSLLIVGTAIMVVLMISLFRIGDGPIIAVVPRYTIDSATENERCEIEIPISNIGDAPLIIGQFRTSCSCVGILFKDANGKYVPHDALCIRPGEMLTGKASIVARGDSGNEMMSRIEFESNDDKSKLCSIECHIKHIMAGYICSPPSVIFDNVTIGESQEKTVAVYDSIQSNRALADWTYNGPSSVSVEYIPGNTTTGASHIDSKRYVQIGLLRIKYKGDSYNDIDGSVSLLPSKYDKTTTLGVSGSVRKPFRVYPATITLSENEKKTINMVISSNSSANNVSTYAITTTSSSSELVVSRIHEVDNDSRRISFQVERLVGSSNQERDHTITFRRDGVVYSFSVRVRFTR